MPAAPGQGVTCSLMHCRLLVLVRQKSNSVLGKGCSPSSSSCAESLLRMSLIWWDQSMTMVSMECSTEPSTGPARLEGSRVREQRHDPPRSIQGAPNPPGEPHVPLHSHLHPAWAAQSCCAAEEPLHPETWGKTPRFLPLT